MLLVAVTMTECNSANVPLLVVVNSRHQLYSYMNGCETDNQLDMHRQRNHRYVT